MDTDTLPIPTDADDPMLRLAVAAHLARYKGQSRAHTASDLNLYLRGASRRTSNRYKRSAHMSSSTCAGSKKSAASGPQRSRDAYPCWPRSTRPA